VQTVQDKIWHLQCTPSSLARTLLALLAIGPGEGAVVDDLLGLGLGLEGLLHHGDHQLRADVGKAEVGHARGAPKGPAGRRHGSEWPGADV